MINPEEFKDNIAAARGSDPNDWLLRLADIGADAPPPADGATDVSSNKYKYLAEAYSDLHLSKKK